METDFAEIIKDLRNASYTDAQIARLCGCTRQYIGKIGNGETNDIGFRIGQTLTKLHDAIQQ